MQVWQMDEGGHGFIVPTPSWCDTRVGKSAPLPTINRFYETPAVLRNETAMMGKDHDKGGHD
jgi:hypothetical protein